MGYEFCQIEAKPVDINDTVAGDVVPPVDEKPDQKPNIVESSRQDENEKIENDKLFFKKHEPETKKDVSDLDILSEKNLKPVDHLEGVKLEQDGMLNRDFHKETFLGNHEEIEEEPSEIAESKLLDIIVKVDTNADKQLSLEELETWIVDRVQEHFDAALEENDKIFKHLDPDNDGLVDWKEYYLHFLLAKGYPTEKAEHFVQDYDRDVVEMSMKDRDQLIKYKFRWTDADKPPMDNKLGKYEFLAFRHPEQSPQALEQMMNAIFGSLDENDDDRLTEEEFTSLAMGEVEDSEQEDMDAEWQEERRQEFRKSIDRNHDGIATREELLAYLDPRNPLHARSEAENIITLMDNDKDGFLNFKEIMANKNILLNSKVVNVGRSLHDEF
ncbi:hypothetical protein ScPMuIL_009453 [Solemya velum]